MHVFVHRGLEKPHSTPSVAFGTVQRHIGLADQIFGVARIIRVKRDAHTGPDLDGALRQIDRFRQFAHQAPGGPQRFVRRMDVLQEHHKFIATQARCHLAVTHLGLQAAANFNQDRVAR